MVLISKISWKCFPIQHWKFLVNHANSTCLTLEIASSYLLTERIYAVAISLKTYPKVFCLSTFFRYLPREVDPLVYNMSHEDPGNISYSEVGGLSEQIRELREVCTKGICVRKASAVQMQSIISINILSVSWSAYNQHPHDNLFDTPLSHD